MFQNKDANDCIEFHFWLEWQSHNFMLFQWTDCKWFATFFVNSRALKSVYLAYCINFLITYKGTFTSSHKWSSMMYVILLNLLEVSHCTEVELFTEIFIIHVFCKLLLNSWSGIFGADHNRTCVRIRPYIFNRSVGNLSMYSTVY